MADARAETGEKAEKQEEEGGGGGGLVIDDKKEETAKKKRKKPASGGPKTKASTVKMIDVDYDWKKDAMPVLEEGDDAPVLVKPTDLKAQKKVCRSFGLCLHVLIHTRAL